MGNSVNLMLEEQRKVDASGGMGPLPNCTEQCSQSTTSVILSDCRLLQNAQARTDLEAGKTLFYISCVVGNKLESDPRLKEELAAVVNLSSFADEEAENGVPNIDFSSPWSTADYTFLVTKFASLIPKCDISKLTPEFLCSYDYLCKTSPSGVKVMKPGEDWTPKDKHTLRVVQPVFHMLTITLQQKVSEFKGEIPFGPNDIQWDKAFLIERTKMNINKRDSTAKTKVLLLFKQVEGGVLTYSLSIFVNRLIPDFLAQGIDRGKTFAAEQITGSLDLLREYWSENGC